MALLALNRKKQALAPDVRELVKSLTGFENEEHVRECENYVFSNFLHYQQPMVDGMHVQHSIDGLVQKFTVHGFPEKGKKLKTLVDTFINSSLFKDHAQTGVEWYVLQLMINLAYKPTFTTLDDNPLQLHPLPVISPEESFDWGAYLKEGWEQFQLPDDDENNDELWAIQSDEESLNDPEEVEVDLQIVNSKGMKTEEVGSVYISSIPNPSTWKLKIPPIETKQEALIKIIRESAHSKVWLRDNVQNSWWKESHYKENVTCKLKSANFSEIWKQIEKENSTMKDLLVMSEYKVLREILWMFEAPTSTVLFSQDENGKHKVNQSVTVPSITQGSLQCVLTRLCPYFDKLYDMKMFRERLKQGEEEEKPPPYTYNAFCSALVEELDSFTQLLVEIETKVDRQDENNTIISIVTDLDSALHRLTFLHEMYKRCVIDWRTQPSWVCSTRLLSVLYAVLLTPTNKMQLTIALRLFIASFIVYLNIIDKWLCEGQLEDWREEFLVSRNGEELCVMPYEIEMKKCGVTPVYFLSTLFRMVRDAGRSMTHIIKLDKLKVLRESASNKGNLYKEFVDNVNYGFKKLHSTIYNTSSTRVNDVNTNKNLSADTSEVYLLPKDTEASLDNKEIDLPVNTKLLVLSDEKNISVEHVDKINPSHLHDQKEIAFNIENKMPHLNSVEIKPVYITMCDDKITVDKSMHELATQQLNDNPFIIEVFKEYLLDKMEGTYQDKSETSIQLYSYKSAEILDMISVHQVLQKQLQLIYNRHAVSAKIVVETLISEYHLIQHFIVLRKVLLMEAGNLIQNFYTFLFKEMTNKNWRDARGLTMQLGLCIEEEHPELGANFSVILKDEESDKLKSPITEICNISIGYIVEWPVNMVISAETIASYNSIFSFLLCIKYAFWSLYNLRFSDLNKTVENTLKLRRLFVLKMWIQHCVTTIHFYFMGHVLHNYATRLEESVRNAGFIDDIIKAHNRFLNAVQEHCLQKTPPELKLMILQVLELCPMLESLWRLEIEGKLTEDDIAQLEDKYIKTHHALSIILLRIIENASELSSNIGHLTEFNSETSSGLPESHYDSI